MGSCGFGGSNGEKQEDFVFRCISKFSFPFLMTRDWDIFNSQ
jgi:hypothetical protein